MIINTVKAIRPSDIQHFSWSRISQFQNIENTASVLINLHALSSKSEKQNAKNQAGEIRHCLIQAKEYFEAAKNVSLATRPVLLYYSIMSMALAEILLKQTGDSRLARLRENHNCHGLTMSIKSNPKTEDPLKISASNLLCKPQLDSQKNPRGTFEVWKESAREYPVGSYRKVNLQNGAHHTSYQLHLLPSDTASPQLPECGVSLLDCLVELPYMSDVLFSLGVQPEMIRAGMSIYQEGISGDRQSTIIVHPQHHGLIEKFGAKVRADAASINYLEIIETPPSGYIIKQLEKPDSELIHHYPNSICLTDEDIFFSCSDLNLNEFGLLYLALHICGNFCRYYPEQWLKHVEKSTPLAMAIDELCHNSFDRLPLLLLSELTRTYYVVKK